MNNNNEGRMPSDDENIEMHITPSADDILEVSPANTSTAADARSQFSPMGTSSVFSNQTSPTASVRHRRLQQQANDHAFSSSSEETESYFSDQQQHHHQQDSNSNSNSNNSSNDSNDDNNNDDDDDDDDTNDKINDETSGEYNNRSGTDDSSDDEEDDDHNDDHSSDDHNDDDHNHGHEKQPPLAPRNHQKTNKKESQQQQQLPHRNSSNTIGSSGSSKATATAAAATNKSSNASMSEFDKALSTGVPSRGYASAFFSTDSMDSVDAPTELVGEGEAGSNSSGAAAAAAAAALSEQGESTTDANRNQIVPASSPSQSQKSRKIHRVNITTTTQSSSTSSSKQHTNDYLAHKHNNNNHSNKRDAPAAVTGPIHAPQPPPPLQRQKQQQQQPYGEGDQDLSSGVLPDVLMTMRQKIESMQLFDSDMMRLVAVTDQGEEMAAETRESLKRSSQQSISAAVLVSLAHKRYERRRLAAMEIEKVVRSLVQQDELERVRAILLLLSDDYVRSTSEDARKGGVVALAACAIGLKKASDHVAIVMECRDLILASVVHACQDHSQRVRYYATESLFNVVKVIPQLAVQHFFILFEILRSLWADVDVDVRSGAELLDKKLKEVILGAVNSGSFSTDACVPVFARFVYMKNKATKKLTLSWLQELNEKLIGAPILEFLHLFLGGIFEMIADPSLAIRQSALAFLQSVLPKLLVCNSEAIDDLDSGMKVDFDKILQSLVTTMEHPDPFVRKVAMFWMSRIVKAHMKELNARSESSSKSSSGKQQSSHFSSPAIMNPDGRISPSHATTTSYDENEIIDKRQTEHGSDFDENGDDEKPQLSAASISVRNSLPHVLPGILLSIGDTFQAKGNSAKDSFLPDQTTNELAEQTNACLRDAVRRDGKSYVQHLDSFIVALREELDSPGGLSSRNPPAEERKLYRLDVNRDGTGIESPGWFRASNDKTERNEESMVSSRLCALHWIIVLYESVVPDPLKAEYAREFTIPIIHQLVDTPPERIVFKSLEVLARITVPVAGEDRTRQRQQVNGASSLSGFSTPQPDWAGEHVRDTQEDDEAEFPMTNANASFALDILHPSRRQFQSRDREVFTALIQLHSYNQQLLVDLARVIAYMCKLQPAEFVLVSFAVELDRFVRRTQKQREKQRVSALVEKKNGANGMQRQLRPFSSDLEFVSSFVEKMCHVLLNADEAQPLRDTLRDCVGFVQSSRENPKEHRRVRLFHIMLHSFSHSVVAAVSLCLWGGAYRTASLFVCRIVPLDINLMFLLELDKLVEQLERPLFRHLHVRMLERDIDPTAEGSGAMLFKTLKFLLMIIPQSTCYNVLKDRLVSVSRFRQSTGMMPRIDLGPSSDQNDADKKSINEQTAVFVERVLKVRAIHCDAMWETIRAESLETQPIKSLHPVHEVGESRRQWLGYASKEEQNKAEDRYQREKKSQQQGGGLSIEEMGKYQDFELGEEPTDSAIEQQLNENFEAETDLEEVNRENPPETQAEEEGEWKAYWEDD